MAVGCIYGLVALGFVLKPAYKATELVNFAQGDPADAGRVRLLHGQGLGGALDYSAGLPDRGGTIAAFGALLDVVVLRRVISQPQFAVVMLDTRPGVDLPRSFATVTWCSRRSTPCRPLRRRVAAGRHPRSASSTCRSVIGTLVLCRRALRLLQLHAASAWPCRPRRQNQLAAYYMGIPVEADLLADLGDLGGRGQRRRACAGLAPVTLIDINMGLAVALKAFAAAVLGGFGSIPGALLGGIIIGPDRSSSSGATLPDGFKDTMPIISVLPGSCSRSARKGLFGKLWPEESVGVAYSAFRLQDLL